MLLTRSYDYDAPSLTSRRSHSRLRCGNYDCTEFIVVVTAGYAVVTTTVQNLSS